jgi:hypothetical protein
MTRLRPLDAENDDVIARLTRPQRDRACSAEADHARRAIPLEPPAIRSPPIDTDEAVDELVSWRIEPDTLPLPPVSSDLLDRQARALVRLREYTHGEGLSSDAIEPLSGAVLLQILARVVYPRNMPRATADALARQLLVEVRISLCS